MGYFIIESEQIYNLNDLLIKFRELKDQTPPASPHQDVWITAEQVCHLLNISKRTLLNCRNNGIIPFSRFHRKVYFQRSDIETYLARHYVKGR